MSGPSRAAPAPRAAEPTGLDLEAALRSVRSLLAPTPLLPSPELSHRLAAPVLLKLENLQVTGSFKVRGAVAKLLSLPEEARGRGVVACSSGNHALAVAWAARRLGVPATVAVPSWIDPLKLTSIHGLGAEVVLAGDGYDEAERVAARLAAERGLEPVHPFDDPVVAAGQGTLALEILEERPDVGTVVVPLSGGGLAGGVAFALRRAAGGVRTVAASAERARVMLESLRQGRALELPDEETLASALSGGIGLPNRVTLALVRELVDEHVVVEEDAIARAMAWAFRSARLVVEGGGAVGLAALLEGAVAAGDARPLVVVVSGGNVSGAVLRRVLEGAGPDPGARGPARRPAPTSGAPPPPGPRP